MKNISVRLAFLVLAVLIVLPVVSSVNNILSNKVPNSLCLAASGSPLPQPAPPVTLRASGSPLPQPTPPVVILSASGSPLPQPTPPVLVA